MFWTIFLFMMELMVEQVSRRIQFGLIILVVGASFVVWVSVRPTCSDCVPVRVLAVEMVEKLAIPAPTKTTTTRTIGKFPKHEKRHKKGMCWEEEKNAVNRPPKWKLVKP